MSKICFFTSIGDNLSIIDYIKKNYNYDIVCNYYGSNDQIYDQLKTISKYCENNKLCKFPAAKKLFDVLSSYDFIFVYDDDALVIKGNLDSLINIGQKYKLDIVSSAHDPHGKISWKIHCPIHGEHLFRYVNFIEINYPIFSRHGFMQFMQEYDGLLCDWGIDYWYCKILNPTINYNFGIVDSVVIHNPDHSTRLNNNFDPYKRVAEMDKYLIKYNISKVDAKTLDYCYI